MPGAATPRPGPAPGTAVPAPGTVGPSPGTVVPAAPIEQKGKMFLNEGKDLFNT